jgi:hypothetical protein
MIEEGGEGGLKGLCHEMNDLLEVTKSQIRTLCMPMVFIFFYSLVMEKINLKYLLASLKTHTNYENS